MEFVEIKHFTDKALKVLTDDNLSVLQSTLNANPESGNLIRGGAGARKIRVAVPGRGKSGGARVIYYFQKENKIWFLDFFTKNEKENLSKGEVEWLASLIRLIKG